MDGYLPSDDGKPSPKEDIMCKMETIVRVCFASLKTQPVIRFGKEVPGWFDYFIQTDGNTVEWFVSDSRSYAIRRFEEWLERQ